MENRLEVAGVSASGRVVDATLIGAALHLDGAGGYRELYVGSNGIEPHTCTRLGTPEQALWIAMRPIS